MQPADGKICFLYFALTFLIAPCFAVDNTLVAGSTGTAVVESCVAKIYDSKIFKEDFNLIRYSAYADTKDGLEIDGNQNFGGIWAVDSEAFEAILNETYNVTSYYDAINTTFNIDWTQVEYSELNIPMYSALAQRLHLAYWESQATLTDDITILGVWWALRLHNVADDVLVSDFTTRIADIFTGCSKPERDVVFLIDSSTVGTYLDDAKPVVENIIKQLKIDSNPNATVVGIAQYSSQLKTGTYLNGSASEADVLSVVSSLGQLSGPSMTGSSVSSTISSYFSTGNGAKGWETGTPQVLCVLTGGSSIDSLENIASVASSNAVNIIAVGITNDASLAELNQTATPQVSDHVFQLSEFSTTTDMEYAITRQICADTALIPSDATVISGTISANGTRSITMLVNSSGIDTKISTTDGSINLYYSATKKQPSSANHDYSLLVRSNEEVAFQYTPTTEELQHHGGGDTVYLYITIEGDSNVDTQFTFTVRAEDAVTVIVNWNGSNTTQDPNGSSGGLSEGEIAGIVFSCLIVFCAVLVAIVYYRFGGPSGSQKRPLIHKGSLDRPMDSRAQQKRLEVSVRDRLQSAIKRRDMSDISEAVEDFMALKMEDFTGDFVTAQRMLAIQQCKQGITRAIASRNIKMLEKAIFRGKRMEYDMELKMELVNAEILLQDLKKTDNLLRRLKRAMDAGDLMAAEAITAELRVLKGCDQAMVDRMLQVFQYRDDIEESMERRDIAAIHESMARIIERAFESDLAAEMRQARKLLKDLTSMEQARNDVMGLKQSRVSEIKSYSTPPPGVQEVMMSVYLLLSYHPTQLQSWTAIQALMGKTGREGLRRRIGDLEVVRIDIMHARMAKSLLANFDLHSIREISEALAVFYNFAKSVIKEAEKLHPEGDYDTESDIYEGISWSTPIIKR